MSAVAVAMIWTPTTAATAQPNPMWIVADLDDDDRDGIPDNRQPGPVHGDDLAQVPEMLLHGATSARLRGRHARLINHNGMPVEFLNLEGSRGPRPRDASLRLQGVSPGPATLELTLDHGRRLVPIHVARIRWLNGTNQPLNPATNDVTFPLRLTNDGSLPRSVDPTVESTEPRDLRVELTVDRLAGKMQPMAVNVLPRRHLGSGVTSGLRIQLKLRRKAATDSFRSRHIRLVADAIDQKAPGTSSQTVQAGTLDRLQAEWTAPNGQVLHQEIMVGLRTPQRGSVSAYRARIRVHILRTHAGGPPVVGLDPESARSIAVDQVRAAERIWNQCGLLLQFDPGRDLDLPSPPPPALLAVADGNGLPAAGGGVIDFYADRMRVGPMATSRGASPLDTAMAIATELKRLGLAPTVTRNAPTQFGTAGSADIVVRDANGKLVTLQAPPSRVISNDRQQRVTIGSLDLRDGLDEFGNRNARAGTLEERTMLKTLSDADPTTIDVFFINRFSSGSRQGEAFIERSGSPLLNAVVLDRVGLSQRDNAWTLAHELGHVLLDAPLHPDNLGPDRPWLLMDADSSRGSVYGPKRLTQQDCSVVLQRSGPDSIPALLKPIRYRSLQ